MNDELEQLTDDRPVYEAPRATRLGDTHPGAGADCDPSGSGATNACQPAGSTAQVGCADGSNPIGCSQGFGD